jgi:hypothetical protein
VVTGLPVCNRTEPDSTDSADAALDSDGSIPSLAIVIQSRLDATRRVGLGVV